MNPANRRVGQAVQALALPFYHKILNKAKILQKPSVRQFVRYALAGVLNVTVGYTVYFVLLLLHVNVQVAMGANWLAGALNGYFWSKYWVFRQPEKNTKRFLHFCAMAVTFMFVSMFLVTLFVNNLGLNKILGGILAGALTTLLNFTVQKTLVFKE